MRGTAHPRLILTPGEPAGIGPDVVIRSAWREVAASVVVLCDPDLLRQRARRLGLEPELVEYRPEAPPEPGRAGRVCFLPAPLAQPVEPGQPDHRNAAGVLAAIRRAVTACLEGEFDAMVTGPVNKAVIARAGQAFTGHTEYIAGLCGRDTPVMMLANKFARVALVTTHLPLREVAGQVTRQRLRDVIRVVDGDLRAKFGISRPRLLVCGLNPHAGEQGHLGAEELEVIRPVLDELRRDGLELSGPAPADTAFTPASLEGVDAVLAMYHDQGLPVLKSHGFGDTVNVTLGLPLIRTSVDHGTALELAGAGLAKEDGLVAALDLAASLARRAD